MSLIMDALRKSERQRQRSLAGQLSAMAPSPYARRQRAPWGLIIGILLLLNAALGVALLWHQERQPATAATAAVPATPAQSEPQPQVRSLAAEAAAGASDETSPAPATTAVADKPAQAAQADSTPPAAATTDTDTSDANVVPLDALPDSFRQALPALHLDVHSYSPNPAQRFVLINMHRYQEGDVLTAGPKVVRITPEGVILSYRGQRFLLPRQ